jgi:hypothetical protein
MTELGQHPLAKPGLLACFAQLDGQATRAITYQVVPAEGGHRAYLRPQSRLAAAIRGTRRAERMAVTVEANVKSRAVNYQTRDYYPAAACFWVSHD